MDLLVGIVSLIMFMFYILKYKIISQGSLPFPLLLYIAMFPYKLHAISFFSFDDLLLKFILLFGFVYMVANNMRSGKGLLRYNPFEFSMLCCVCISDFFFYFTKGTTSQLITGFMNYLFVFVLGLYAVNAISSRESVKTIANIFSINTFPITIIALIQWMEGGSSRVISTFTNPNYFAFYVCISFVLAAYFIETKWKYAVMAADAFAVLLTGSFTCTAMLVISVAIYVFVRSYGILRVMSVATCITISIVVFAIFILSASGKLWELGLVQRILLQKDSVRLFVWQDAINRWKLNPIFGIGYNIYKFYNDFFTVNYVTHNDYVRVLVELGSFGLFFFFNYVFRMMRKARNLCLVDAKMAISLIIMCLIFILFHNNLNNYVWWMMIAMPIHLERISRIGAM